MLLVLVVMMGGPCSYHFFSCKVTSVDFLSGAIHQHNSFFSHLLAKVLFFDVFLKSGQTDQIHFIKREGKWTPHFSMHEVGVFFT